MAKQVRRTDARTGTDQTTKQATLSTGSNNNCLASGIHNDTSRPTRTATMLRTDVINGETRLRNRKQSNFLDAAATAKHTHASGNSHNKKISHYKNAFREK
ncbi:MAG: hypothetical protein QQN46_05635 [Nitrosopumilus sp.]